MLDFRSQMPFTIVCIFSVKGKSYSNTAYNTHILMILYNPFRYNGWSTANSLTTSLANGQQRTIYRDSV